MTSINPSEWTRLLGTSGSDQGYDLTTGSDGSIYVTGYTTRDLDEQTNNGNQDAFISKYNPDGTKEWTRLLGSAENDEGNALITGSDGSIYIAGFTKGDLDGQVNSGGIYGAGGDAFLSKYNPDGTKDWTKLLGSSSVDVANSLTTGNDGSIYIAGYTSGDLDGQTNNGGRDAFITKFNTDGTKEWTRLLGSAENEKGNALTTGNDGSIYITGGTYGDLDGQTNHGSQNPFINKYNPGSQDAFISKYNPDGIKEWTKLLGTDDDDEGNALTTGSDGSIYISGYTYGDLDDQANSGGYYDAFVSKFNPDGSKEWTKLLGNSGSDEGNALTTGSDGSIHVAGNTNGDLDGQTNNGSRDAFISKYNPDGTKEWTRLLGSSLDETGMALTTGNDGSIYITGGTYGDLDGQTNSNDRKDISVSYDVFISKISNLFPPTGIQLSTSTFNENINENSLIATLKTIDGDTTDTHTFSLVSGEGDTDNASFTIDGNYLKINSSPDYEAKSSYSVRIKTIDSGAFTYEEHLTLNVNDLFETGSLTEMNNNNNNYGQYPECFSSISGSAPVKITAYEVGEETTLDAIKDYDGNLHAGDTLEETPSSYKYHGLLDVNCDGVFEGIFTNKVSRRWVTVKVDSVTGQVDFDDNGAGGGTRVVGIYEDPLIAVGNSNNGFLSDDTTPAPAAIGATGSDRYIDINDDGDFDDQNEDRLALNSQVRFQNDLEIDNLSAKHSGDYDGDGIHEVYWKINDGTAYLRSLMHDDGNIRYANYQSEIQMREYLVSQGHTEIISDII